MVELYNQCFFNKWSLNHIKCMIDNGAEYIVEKLNDRIIGMLIYKCVDEFSEIITLCVQDNYRRNYVGENLLKKFILKMQKAELKKIFLEVNENNTAAVFLYKKFGFVEIGRRKDYYNEGGQKFDAINMELKLS